MLIKERPILFSGEMVRAILEGRKTQTRRVAKELPHTLPDGCGDFSGMEIHHYDHIGNGEFIPTMFAQHMRFSCSNISLSVKCPYGVPGERLWVRETFCECFSGDEDEQFPHYCYNADRKAGCVSSLHWRPSIHMHRWASRVTLEVTGVRVERVQKITEEDAKVEGAESIAGSNRIGFESLWDSIAKPGAKWEDNPWVWVIEYRRVDS